MRWHHRHNVSMYTDTDTDIHLIALKLCLNLREYSDRVAKGCQPVILFNTYFGTNDLKFMTVMIVIYYSLLVRVVTFF